VQVVANNWSDIVINLQYENDATGARTRHVRLVRMESDGSVSTQDFPIHRLAALGYNSATALFLGELNDIGQLLAASSGSKVGLFRYDFETDGLVVDDRVRGGVNAFFLNDFGQVACKAVSRTLSNGHDAVLWKPDQRTITVLAYETKTSTAFSFTNMKGISRAGDASGYTVEFKNGGYLPIKYLLFKGGKSYNVKALAPTNAWLQTATLGLTGMAMNSPGQIYLSGLDGVTGEPNLVFLTPN
jgi:hypothetical protein